MRARMMGKRCLCCIGTGKSRKLSLCDRFQASWRCFLGVGTKRGPKKVRRQPKQWKRVVSKTKKCKVERQSSMKRQLALMIWKEEVGSHVEWWKGVKFILRIMSCNRWWAHGVDSSNGRCSGESLIPQMLVMELGTLLFWTWRLKGKEMVVPLIDFFWHSV